MRAARAAAPSETIELGAREVVVTHPNRVLFPADGMTEGDARPLLPRRRQVDCPLPRRLPAHAPALAGRDRGSLVLREEGAEGDPALDCHDDAAARGREGERQLSAGERRPLAHLVREPRVDHAPCLDVAAGVDRLPRVSPLRPGPVRGVPRLHPCAGGARRASRARRRRAPDAGEDDGGRGSTSWRRSRPATRTMRRAG